MKKFKKSTKPVIIQNKNHSTVKFVFIYPSCFELQELYNLNLAKNIMQTTSQEYESEKEFNKALSKNMMNMNIYRRTSGNLLFIRIELYVPKEGLIKNFSLDDAFKMFVNTIYKPFTVNNAFDEEKFSVEKKYHLTRVKDGNRSIRDQLFYRFIEIIDPEEQVYVHYPNRLGYWEKTSNKDAYKAYKKHVIDAPFFSYVVGDISKNRVNELYNKYLSLDNKNIEFAFQEEKFLPFLPYEEIEETSSFNQSALCMLYQVENMLESEKDMLSFIVNILATSENDLIFNALRLENNLVYSSHVEKHIKNGFFFIETYMSAKSKERAIEVIKETIDKLKDESLLQEARKKLLRGMQIEILRSEDAKYNELERIIENDTYRRSTEEKYKAYKGLEIKDVIKFLDRVKLTKVFFLRGDENENN